LVAGQTICGMMPAGIHRFQEIGRHWLSQSAAEICPHWSMRIAQDSWCLHCIRSCTGLLASQYLRQRP